MPLLGSVFAIAPNKYVTGRGQICPFSRFTNGPVVVDRLDLFQELLLVFPNCFHTLHESGTRARCLPESSSAGAYDLPGHFYAQVKDQGLLLIAIKTEGEGDNLFLLRKNQDHFESLESQAAGFVQMRGKYEIDSLEPIPIETVPEWTELKHKQVSKAPFWWGGKGKAGFAWRTLGIRSFLGITEPDFRAFKTEKANERSHEEYYFGLWDKEHRSLVLAKDDCLIAYGNSTAKERLLRKVSQWVKLGMPVAASLALKIYPSDLPLKKRKNQWIVKRRESQFLWSLEA
jgi:hypothetical protein